MFIHHAAANFGAERSWRRQDAIFVGNLPCLTTFSEWSVVAGLMGTVCCFSSETRTQRIASPDVLTYTDA